jgi:hypothetical protein
VPGASPLATPLVETFEFVSERSAALPRSGCASGDPRIVQTADVQLATAGSGALIWSLLSVGVVVIFVMTFLQRRRGRGRGY